MASGWKPKTSSSRAYSSSVGLTMSSQKVAPWSRRAAARASGEVSRLTRPSADLMNARSMPPMYQSRPSAGAAGFTRGTLVYIRVGMELPHTVGCLVCGRQNLQGLGLSLNVDEGGLVWTEFTPRREHIGF